MINLPLHDSTPPHPHAIITNQVDLKKVNMDVIKHWVSQQVTELMGVEDEVTYMMVINQLESVRPD